MNITIAAATRFEIKGDLFTNIAEHNITFLYTGVGLLVSAVSLMQHALQQKPELIIQAGIAGSFSNSVQLGNVVVVKSECLGDTGVMEKEGWKDVFDMGFTQANEAPFAERNLPNNWLQKLNMVQLPAAAGVTVNQVTTTPERMTILQTKYNAEIESMEGAALHYVCRLVNIPFLQIRGISNLVGERDKSKWKIKEAIENVNKALVELLEKYRTNHML